NCISLRCSFFPSVAFTSELAVDRSARCWIENVSVATRCPFTNTPNEPESTAVAATFSGDFAAPTTVSARPLTATNNHQPNLFVPTICVTTCLEMLCQFMRYRYHRPSTGLDPHIRLHVAIETRSI